MALLGPLTYSVLLDGPTYLVDSCFHGPWKSLLHGGGRSVLSICCPLAAAKPNKVVSFQKEAECAITGCFLNSNGTIVW